MRKITAIMSLILIALFGLFSAAQEAFAVDPPHNGQNSMGDTITCDVCHYDPANEPGWVSQPSSTDNTYFNRLCTSCHNEGYMTRTSYAVKTHSSTFLATGKYAPWTVECRVCHNPHYQDQISSYPTDSTSNLLTGTITAYSQVPVGTPTSTIIVNATGGLNNWKDYMLVPNILYPTRMYRILSNTGTSFTVIGVVNANYAKPTNTWAVRLSSMLHAQLRTPVGALETVKFFNPDSSKPNSYASSTSSANVTGICQVCHTQTKSFNRTGVTGSIQEGPNHPAGVVATGQKCTQCHIHTEGFKGECNTCHGSPPIDTATLITRDSTGATVTSDSPGPGAHNAHVASLGYDCATCHSGGMLAGQSEGDNKINIGFFLLSSNLGGSYDGASGRNYYSYASGTGSPTTVTFGGTLRCTNLYCHSSGQGSTSLSSAPVYTQPRWNVPADGACGTCHQTKTGHARGPITSGSHTSHIAVSGTGCDDCHTGADANANSYASAAHVNKFIDVANNYTAGGLAGNGYGTCSQVSCHASPYSTSLSTVVTPMWGTIAGCNACHSANPIAATGPNTGGHALHNETNCQRCHNAGTTSTSEPSTEHTNGLIDTANVGYTDNKAKGSPYTTCSTASCHANVYGAGTTTTPVWGTTNNGCNACHSANPITATGPNTGGHALHNETDCTRCHNAGTTSTSAPGSEHATGFIDTRNVGYTDNKAKGSPYTTCSTASCHANVYGSGTSTTPVWGTTNNLCSACHSVAITAAGPATGSHVLHANSAGTLCTTCHAAGTSHTTVPSTGHTDGDIDVTSGYTLPNKAKGTAYVSCATTNCHGSTSPVWGANTTGAQCVKCHGVAGTSTASYIANSDLAAPGYNAAGRDTSGSLGNPTAGGVSPDQQVGAHDTHLRGLGVYKTGGIVCTDCHAVSSLTDSGHMNGAATFAWSALATNSGALAPSYAGGVCSNIACHGMSANVVNRGTDTTPSWTDGNYIPSAAAALTSCGVCHQSPPPKYRNGTTDHPGVTLGTNACNACHQHTGSGPTHIDGTLQASGGDCSSCHDYDVDANGDWGKNPRAVEGFGAHAMHIKHLKDLNNVTLNATSDNFDTSNFNAVCGVCHTRDSGNHDMGGTPNTRTINFGDGRALYSFATASGLPVYYGQTDVSSASIEKTCSNVSCHFKPAPVWQGL